MKRRFQCFIVFAYGGDMLTLDELNRILFCDVENGLLYWKSRPRSDFSNDFTCRMFNFKAGKVAGGVNGDGYIVIHHNGESIFAHDAVWLFAGNELIDGLVIDHINHIRSDNRIKNLRMVSELTNSRNQKLHSNNISGYSGVRRTKSGKWSAHIRVNGKERQIGTFLTMDEAVKARKNAEEINGYHDNHGRDIYVDLPYIDPWNRIN